MTQLENGRSPKLKLVSYSPQTVIIQATEELRDSAWRPIFTNTFAAGTWDLPLGTLDKTRHQFLRAVLP